MDWSALAAWISLAVVLIFAGLALARGIGSDQAKVSTRLDNIEEKLERFTKYHYEHYQHSDDEDKHWTKREREVLNEAVKELGRDMKEILRRSANNGK